MDEGLVISPEREGREVFIFSVCVCVCVCDGRSLRGPHDALTKAFAKDETVAMQQLTTHAETPLVR